MSKFNDLYSGIQVIMISKTNAEIANILRKIFISFGNEDKKDKEN